MQKWMKITSMVGGGVLIAGAGAGTVAGIVIPKALKAKSALTAFVTEGGPSNLRNFSGAQKKLNYVALGDSETAGFNMRLGRDYLSYADFLANDLKKVGKLNSYRNYAVSGDKIPDMTKMFEQNTSLLETLKHTDLISLTIGANDLLSFVEVAGIPFSALYHGFNLAQNSLVRSVADREKIFDKTINGGVNTNDGYHTSESSEAIVNRVASTLRTIETNRSLNKVLDFNAHIKPKVFDLIKRNFAAFIRDLHLLAPNAQITVLGHAMPFPQWDKSALDTPRSDFASIPGLTGQNTVREAFYKFLDSMEEGCKSTVDKPADFTTFIRVDKLSVHKTSDPSRDGANKHFTDYIKYGEIDNVTKKKVRPATFTIQNAMPLAGDIHPSTFGHEVIGNSLFSWLAPYLGISEKTAEDNYTLSKPFTNDNTTQDFERIDENPSKNNLDANGHQVEQFTMENIMYDLFNMQGIGWRLLKSLHGLDATGLIKQLLTGSFANIIQQHMGTNIDPQLIAQVTKGLMSGTSMPPKLVIDYLNTLKASVNSAEQTAIDTIVGTLSDDPKPYTQVINYLNKAKETASTADKAAFETIITYLESKVEKSPFQPVIDLLMKMAKKLDNPVITNLINGSFFRNLIAKQLSSFMPLLEVKDGIHNINDLFKTNPTQEDFKKAADWERGMEVTPLTADDVASAKAFFADWLDSLGQSIAAQTSPNYSSLINPTTGSPLSGASDFAAYKAAIISVVNSSLDSALLKVKSATTDDEKLYWTATAAMYITKTNGFKWQDEIITQIISMVPLEQIENMFKG